MSKSLSQMALGCILAVLIGGAARAGGPAAGRSAGPPGSGDWSHPGYRLLTTKAYLPPDFDQQTFDELWQTWELPLRSRAAAATLAERRRMAFDRYGLTSAPGDDPARPQQYVVDSAGNWTMNCLACHQGKVAGRVLPGVPNSLYALETLTEDVRRTKARLKKRPTRMEIGSMFMPLGTTNGTTNAVMFGVALMARRDAALNILPLAAPPPMTHHDCDAPAWWLFGKKQRIYYDGFAAKGHRSLMQFLLVKENGPERFHEWEDDYRVIYGYLESLRAPKYPFPIDAALAASGKETFGVHCARCHGNYGTTTQRPDRIVPIDEIATDPVRLEALSAQHRQAYGKSWFADFGRQKTIAAPVGYLAPPLDGVWATAPYFHNGSVPTLWHVLHSGQRPLVWQRTADGYDQQRVGLELASTQPPPITKTTARERRQWFDTRSFGKSAAGHYFPDELDESEKRAVLEYLKTL